MISLKGRIIILQYAPKKPTKWGMKAFVLADSITGYNCNWKLYTSMYGKSIKAEILLNQFMSLGLPYNIIENYN